jgi:hypothetical protein
VQRFVEAGGGFVGVCAGAFYGCAIGILPGVRVVGRTVLDGRSKLGFGGKQAQQQAQRQAQQQAQQQQPRPNGDLAPSSSSSSSLVVVAVSTGGEDGEQEQQERQEEERQEEEQQEEQQEEEEEEQEESRTDTAVAAGLMAEEEEAAGRRVMRQKSSNCTLRYAPIVLGPLSVLSQDIIRAALGPALSARAAAMASKSSSSAASKPASAISGAAPGWCPRDVVRYGNIESIHRLDLYIGVVSPRRGQVRNTKNKSKKRRLSVKGNGASAGSRHRARHRMGCTRRAHQSPCAHMTAACS